MEEIWEADFCNRAASPGEQNGISHSSLAAATIPTRTLPMGDDVHACFQRILASRKPPAVEPMIDGYSGFLFVDKDDRPMVAMHWEKYFQHAL